MKKTTRLRRLIEQPELGFLMEAHSGLSARVVEEAGFDAIWASSLAIAAALGVRDSNEASWTQVVEVAEFMSDATTIPILLDGDAGYGNFNTMRRVVAKLEQRGIAGICIEDKVYPKTNSLLRRKQQSLADADEFAGRIRAGKGAQSDPDFVIVARVEALIVGAGLREALRRAETYRRAGADAILIHSVHDTADEVLAFKREWGDRHPVVIIPTTYASTPTEVFRGHGFAACIWANHLMRASLQAMQETARRIHAEASVAGVGRAIAPMDEVFRILGEGELEAAERRYLPVRQASARRRTDS
jgi:phosphoenolpyruvate phosphomutase